jgi:hypothetical protein
VSIGLDLGVLLALDFNEDRFLCAFFWVHNGYTTQQGKFLWVDLK